MKILGYAKTFEIDEKIKSILRIKDNYSFFAIPSDILEKFKAKRFDIIDSDNELMLVARKTEQTSESNKPTTKEVLSNAT